MAGKVSFVMVSQGEFWYGRQGKFCYGGLWYGTEWCGRQGMVGKVWSVKFRQGKLWQVRYVQERSG